MNKQLIFFVKIREIIGQQTTNNKQMTINDTK